MEIALGISRFNPEKDSAPYIQDFSVSASANQTILDTMLLAWQQDPTLSFRRSCRSSICGSCAVLINGKPSLACQTLISKAMERGSRIVLEPLPHFEQLKDLVVNLEPFFDSLKKIVPWVVLRDDYKGEMDAEVVRKLQDPAICILCGICESSFNDTNEKRCAGWVKSARLAEDPRDALGKHRLRLLQVPREILQLFIKELPLACPKGITISGNILA